MSRARPVTFPNGDQIWFDTKRSGEKATAFHLELLATVEEIDLDDLLDESLSQGDVLTRLRQALGVGVIPPEVLERRRRFRAARQVQPKCRKCGKEGDSTKHHFINRWILKELANYASLWADRSKNCIPLCIECHRDIHTRDEGEKSIAHLLTNVEKKFAHEAIRALIHEKPKLFELLCLGDPSVSYEAGLIKDWVAGLFLVPEIKQQLRLAA